MTTKKQEIMTVENSGQASPVRGEAEALIAQAIDKKVPVEALERLLTMRRELKAERAKESFDNAMASFQAECPTIKKTKIVSFGVTHYSYAPLESIVEQVKELLSKNGFSYTFDSEESENGLTMFCKVKHLGGHMEVSKFRIGLDMSSKMNISQRSGSASSYGKRYAFCNAFGILTGDEDNDAQVAQAGNFKREFTQNLPVADVKRAEPSLITTDQKADIMTLLPKINKTLLDLDEVVEFITNKTRSGRGISSYQQMTMSEANDLVAWMNNKLDSVKREVDSQAGGADSDPDWIKNTTDIPAETKINIDEVDKGIQETQQMKL